MELPSKLVFYILIVCVANQINAHDSSVNQNINQAIKGAVSGPVNQIISQDIKDAKGSCPPGSVNQNISQDIEGCGGNTSGSINQNIQQKVARGSTLIDQKTVKEIKGTKCDNEFIIKRHRSNCGCKDRDSSEEITVCDGKHTSEIIIKNRESNCKNLEEENSDEISIKYGCEAPKTPKKEKKCEEEIIVKRPKPCGLSSEEVDIKTWIRPCNKCPVKDISSEESCPEKEESSEESCPKKIEYSSEEISEESCPKKDESSEEASSEEDCSSEEHVIDDSQEDEDSFESKPKLPPCKCKNRLESSEELFGYLKDSSTSSSEEEPCRKVKTPCRRVSSEEESEEFHDRWTLIRPKVIRRPVESNCGCKKRQPRRKCSTCKQESSIEQQAIFY